MHAIVLKTLLVTAVAVGHSGPADCAVEARQGTRPGTTIQYRVETRSEAGSDLGARFTPSQIAVLELLNRADAAHLPRLPHLVVPAVWHEDPLAYSPFPVSYPAAEGHAKLLVVDQPNQAFAAYEHGHLVRWGPVSSGRQAHPTPSGVFRLNWRSRGRHSTVNPNWYMEWYFNFDNVQGLALHAYTLPGYPASHACIRLLVRDARWLYDWGEGTTIDRSGRIDRPGTPVIVAGTYAFGHPPPWRTLERLAAGIDLPEVLPAAPDP